VAGTRFKPLRRLYDWVLSWAHSRFGTVALAVHSGTESFIFPIPPDPLLMALTLARPRRGMFYAMVCSIASVLGGLIGYWIGMSAWEAVGARIIDGLGYMDQFLVLQENFQKYTFVAILAAGFTPLPYKVFTIAAGTCNVDLATFALASAISRSARFFLVAGLIEWLGPAIKEKIDKYFDVLSILFLVLLVAGFFVVKVLRH
jgi:membrane protein YqaA with SNARE-associated domain